MYVSECAKKNSKFFSAFEKKSKKVDRQSLFGSFLRSLAKGVMHVYADNEKWETIIAVVPEVF